MKKFSWLLALLFIVPSITQAEEFLYVMSARAKLLESPKFGSTTIENISKGVKVSAVEKKENWYKVKHNDKTGWLSRLSVSSHPPIKRSRRLAKVDEKMKSRSRRRASAVSTTAAVRGLTDINRTRVNNQDRMDFVALEKLDSQVYSEDEIFAFMEQIKD